MMRTGKDVAGPNVSDISPHSYRRTEPYRPTHIDSIEAGPMPSNWETDIRKADRRIKGCRSCGKRRRLSLGRNGEESETDGEKCRFHRDWNEPGMCLMHDLSGGFAWRSSRMEQFSSSCFV